MDLSSVDKILDFAIGQEEAAAEFYTEMARKMSEKRLQAVFLEFAREEMGHKAKLLQVKQGKQLLPSEQRVLDLRIGDQLADVPPTGDVEYQQALIIAMKAEKAAFRLYSDLASATDDPTLKQTLLALAQEEAKHKLRFELEYDDKFYQEN